MEIVVTMIIVGMLGVWIYSLKQEIEDLQKKVIHHPVRKPGETHTGATVKIPAKQHSIQTWEIR